MVISGSIYVIAGGSFGVTWRLNSAQVFHRAKITARDIFADEDEIDISEPPTQDANVQEESEVAAVQPVETVDEAVQAPPPAPAPRGKRRVAGAL